MNPETIINSIVAAAALSLIVGYVYLCEDAKTTLEKAVIVAEKAAKDAKEQAAKDRKAKESADADNKDLRGKLADSDKRLRDERARRSRVPPAPAGSKRPDLATFDRAELERAMAHLDDRGSDIARKGAEATVDLDTAKRWAQKP